MKTYQIHFIRHGITDGNMQGQYIGSSNPSLNEVGRAQIEYLDANYIYSGAAAYFTSPMDRCRETLELIYPNAKPIVIDAFRECDFGEFEGLTAEQLKDCKEFSEWLASDGQVAPPNGESGAVFGHRVCQAFERIVEALMKTGTQSAVVVAHGGTIMTILAQYGLPEASMAEWAMEPGCGYSVRIHPQMWTSGRMIEVYQQLPLPKEDDDEDDGYYEEAYLLDVEENSDNTNEKEGED